MMSAVSSGRHAQVGDESPDCEEDEAGRGGDTERSHSGANRIPIAPNTWSRPMTRNERIGWPRCVLASTILGCPSNFVVPLTTNTNATKPDSTTAAIHMI
jgi:hypothetical protein